MNSPRVPQEKVTRLSVDQQTESFLEDFVKEWNLGIVARLLPHGQQFMKTKMRSRNDHQSTRSLIGWQEIDNALNTNAIGFANGTLIDVPVAAHGFPSIDLLVAISF